MYRPHVSDDFGVLYIVSVGCRYISFVNADSDADGHAGADGYADSGANTHAGDLLGVGRMVQRGRLGMLFERLLRTWWGGQYEMSLIGEASAD